MVTGSAMHVTLARQLAINLCVHAPIQGRAGGTRQHRNSELATTVCQVPRRSFMLPKYDLLSRVVEALRRRRGGVERRPLFRCPCRPIRWYRARIRCLRRGVRPGRQPLGPVAGRGRTPGARNDPVASISPRRGGANGTMPAPSPTRHPRSARAVSILPAYRWGWRRSGSRRRTAITPTSTDPWHGWSRRIGLDQPAFAPRAGWPARAA
jgi:hypothetical protein